MFAGPIFHREVLTLPRQLGHYLARSGYVGLLFVLIYTAAQTTFGFQDVRGIAAMADFGGLVFQILAFVQLTLVLFFSLLFAAGNVSQEKDRETLVLLLMTDLRNHEIVLGKLFAGLLPVATLIVSSIPVFAFLQLLGGVDFSQIVWLFGLSAVSALLAGSWGAFVAFWKEKTFQTLAIGVLGIVAYLGVLEAVALLSPASSGLANVANMLSPFRAMARIMSPLSDASKLGAVTVSAFDALGAMAALAVTLNAVAINRLRVWNPSRAFHVGRPAEKTTVTTNDESPHAQTKSRHRVIWSNPVLWREIMTRAYGRKIAFIKLIYVLIAGAAAYQLITADARGEAMLGIVSPAAFAFGGLGILALMLINAQAVTSITTERDGKTLDLIVATEITAKEFVFGKLGGIFFNTKELFLVPLILTGWFVASGSVSAENGIYLAFGFLTLVAFAAMLGLHSGLGFASSKSAIANSLGTMFFLCVGIFVLMVLLVEARGSFGTQIQAFLVFIVAGSLALVHSLTSRNPSPALRLAGGALPFLTFYAITTFLLRGSLGVCVAIFLAYGFTTLAMLIPAVSEFDVALGRSTVDKG